MPTKKVVKKRINKTSNVEHVTFFNAIRDYWTGFVKFDGVSNRAQYWWAVLFMILVGFVFNLVRIPVLSAIVSAIMFFPSRAVAFRRFHDAGLSGWWNLAPCLIFMGWAGLRSEIWLFMLNLEWFPADLKWFLSLFFIWSIFNLVVVLLPSKVRDNPYRK